jgi:opacity protein-like surface antigen
MTVSSSARSSAISGIAGSASESFASLFAIPGCAARCFDTYHANLRTGVVLGNAYVDVGTWYGITPFVGAGVGVAFHQFTDPQDVSVQPAGGFGFADDKNQTNLAWAVMAGVGYTVNPRLKLELGYRYLNMGTIFKVSSHDFRLGMRWLFNDLPPPPPPPLIRKY